jgi:GT2 family glycosyltransferase
MDLSIIIVNWNSARYTLECISSILSTTHRLEYEIIVVDNASTDDSRHALSGALPRTKVILSPENVGFARANNLAVPESRGHTLLFLNPDTRVIGDAIPRLFAALQASPSIGAVGCRLLNGDLTLQTSCLQRFPTIFNQLTDIEWLKRQFPTLRLWGMAPLFAHGTGVPFDVQAVSGACVMLKRSTFDRVGWFSTDYFLYTEDIDLCYKVRQAGLRVGYVADAEVIHYGGGSSDKESDGFSEVLMRESIKRFLRKTRGERYAAVYRLAMRGTASLRILLLRLAGLFLFDQAALSRSMMKWRKISSWSRGQEPWAEQLGVRRPEAVAR